jgi:uncharacterized membrane protein
MRRIASVFLRSFLQGLLLLSPIAITAYVLYSVFNGVDNLVPIVPRGVGFILIITFVTTIGYLGTRLFVGRWLFDAFGHVMERTPGVKYIFSSVRDLIQSFVGDKKSFDKAVWVCVSLNPETWRIGFMTQTDMTHLGMGNRVAVYMPHSYAISGWVIVTDAKNIKPVVEMTAGEAMKFAVSGGITTIDDAHKHTTETKL